MLFFVLRRTCSELSSRANCRHCDLMAQDIKNLLESFSQRLRHLVRLEQAADSRAAAQYRLLRTLFVDRTITFDREADAANLRLVREAISELGLAADFLALDFELDLAASYHRLSDFTDQLDAVSADMHCISAANLAGEALPCESVQPLLKRADVRSIVHRRQSCFQLHKPAHVAGDRASVPCVLVGHVRDAMML